MPERVQFPNKWNGKAFVHAGDPRRSPTASGLSDAALAYHLTKFESTTNQGLRAVRMALLELRAEATRRGGAILREIA